MKRALGTLAAITIFAFLFVVARPAMSGEPTEQLKGTIDRVLVILQDGSLKGSKNKGPRRAALSKAVSNSFSFKEMGRRSLGKNWKNTTTEEKKAFVSAFKNLIQNSYFSKMEQYTDEKIIYDNEKMTGKNSTVKTLVITTSGTEIPIDYRMKINKKGKWMVYDIIVEGISLVSNYRSSFAAELKKGNIGKLTASLEKKSLEEEAAK